MTTLTLTHFRFQVKVTKPIQLRGYYAGNYLRNALASVMLRTTCTETHRHAKPTPEHAATCPACWLLAAEVDAGNVGRAYTVLPAQPVKDVLQEGEIFTFGLTLFGSGFQFLPYFVLAVAEVGRVGLGPGRGTFTVQTIDAMNPFTQTITPVMVFGDDLVQVPSKAIDWRQAMLICDRTLPIIRDDLTVRFLTPTRLLDNKRLIKTPDFGVFFRRLLYRVDQLGQQWASDERRAKSEIVELGQIADKVRLVDADIQWIDMKSYSGRTQRTTHFSGFVGQAIYRSVKWDRLLPWLIWGQGVQVGKNTVKGNGIYELQLSEMERYWHWLEALPTR